MALLSLYSCSKSPNSATETKNANAQMSSNQSTRVVNHSEGDAASQQKANEYIEKINASFSPGLNRSANQASSYPDYYGGSFIDEQGKLVIYIKGDLAKGKQLLSTITGSSEFTTRPCQHSYQSLVDIMSKLNEIKLNPANKSKSNNFNTYALMDSKNQIIVDLDDYNDQQVAQFKKNIINSSAIVFQKSSGRLIEEADLNPGCKAEADAAGSYGSFSFRAKRNSDGKVGMVTAGHVVSVGGSLYYNGAVIGTCTIAQNSGSVDAAFVPVNNTTSYVPTNQLCGTTTQLSTSTSLPSVGTTVNMRGATTGTSSGAVVSTNASTTNASGVTFTNLTSASYASQSGDSGGIIYTYISSTNTRYTVGIHKGNNGVNAYFTKANLALSALGVSRY